MGLDIGVVHEIRWTPQPGWEFWNYLSPHALDEMGGNDSLTLDGVREAFKTFKDKTPSMGEIDQAREFVQWCENYWEERGYGGEDGISIITSS